MKKRKSGIPVKPLIGLAIIFLVLSVAAVIVVRSAKKSRLFTVRDIIIRQDNNSGNNIDISFLLGSNILSLNMKEEEHKIAMLYPAYRQVRLIRVLPDRLFAYFIRRRPIACVKLYRYFYVDSEGVLFDIPADAAGIMKELPLINGIDTKIFGPKAGRKYNARELMLGVNIIKAIRSNRQLRGIKINKIDVSDPVNASFVVSLPLPPQVSSASGIEVKIGPDYIADKINMLAGLLIQGKSDWGNIKYFDLRFKEPVVKFNDAKTTKTKK